MENDKLFILLLLAAGAAAIWLFYDTVAIRNEIKEIDEEIFDIDEWLLNASFEKIAELTRRVDRLERMTRQINDAVRKGSGNPDEQGDCVECCRCHRIVPIEKTSRLLFNEGGEPTEAKYFCDDCFGKMTMHASE